LAGVCFAAVYDLAPDSFVLGLKAFPAAILGGLDSVLGATFGGIVVGVIENLVGGYVSSSLKEVAGFLLIVVVLAGIRPPWRDLRQGALIAGVGLGVVRVLGTSVVSGSVGSNPVLASFAVIVVLLLWLNLVARIVLLAAAWTADPQPEPAADDPA
jgi:membrane protein